MTALGPSLREDDTLRTWARKYVRLVLARHQGNKRHAARALGISYHTLKAYLRPQFAEARVYAPPAETNEREVAGAPSAI